MNAKLNLLGMRFGRLLVLSAGDPKWNSGRSRITWLCLCDCGVLRTVVGATLTSGASKSCGCFRREQSLAAHTKHGKTHSRAYSIWASMFARCNNKQNKSYQRYGAKGVKVCQRWSAFENFLSDMGDPPVGMSIDRVNSMGDYEPSNCRWATNTQQCRNRSNTVFLEYQGRKQALGAWAEELGVPYKRLQGRLRAGWTVERIITEPLHPTRGSHG